jgi:hypothetical protein
VRRIGRNGRTIAARLPNRFVARVGVASALGLVLESAAQEETMANKVFAIITDSDREQALEVGLVYPTNCARNKWLDEVKVIFFGPSEKLAAFDAEVQDRVRQMKSYGIEVLACKWCSDRMGITRELEAQGITVVGVGPLISQLIKDGWAQLTF